MDEANVGQELPAHPHVGDEAQLDRPLQVDLPEESDGLVGAEDSGPGAALRRSLFSFKNPTRFVKISFLSGRGSPFFEAATLVRVSPRWKPTFTTFQALFPGSFSFRGARFPVPEPDFRGAFLGVTFFAVAAERPREARRSGMFPPSWSGEVGPTGDRVR